MASSIEPTYRRSSGLVDVLDRVLDKGLVIAGDIRVSLAEVELITIRIRLLVCSIDKAEQIGLDWWRQDPNLSVSAHRLTRRERGPARPGAGPGRAGRRAGGCRWSVRRRGPGPRNLPRNLKTAEDQGVITCRLNELRVAPV